jgi:hypothetical protein
MSLRHIMVLSVWSMRRRVSRTYAELDPSKIRTRTNKTRNMSRLLAVEGELFMSLFELSSLIALRNIRAHKHFGSEFHSDHSYELNPPSYTLLRMVKTPPSGGDTIFTSQAALFDNLSPTFQKTFEGLHAIHTSDVSIRSLFSTAHASVFVADEYIDILYQFCEQWRNPPSSSNCHTSPIGIRQLLGPVN